VESKRFAYGFLISLVVVVLVFAVFFFRTQGDEGVSSAFWSVLVFLLLMFGVIGVSVVLRHRN
jgi:hypothetical protein